MDALIIKPKLADLVLSGAKTWEIRGRRTDKRGTIGIIKSRSGKVYGQVNLVGCIPLTMYDWANNKDKHLVDYVDIDYNTPYAWILANPVIYPEPIPYNHPQGAVIWVKIPEDPEDLKYLANLKRMIRTANKEAERKGYQHWEIELSAIARVMDAQSVEHVPPGAEQVIVAYYERLTGRKAYH